MSHEPLDLTKLLGFPIRPLGDTVFIRRVDVPKSDIIITPDNAKGSPVEGMVLRVGPGRVLDSGVVVPPEVHAGDHVWFIEGFPAEMVVDGEKVLRMKERDLLAARRPTVDELKKLLVDSACRLAHDQLVLYLGVDPAVVPDDAVVVEVESQLDGTHRVVSIRREPAPLAIVEDRTLEQRIADGDAEDADLHGRAVEPDDGHVVTVIDEEGSSLPVDLTPSPTEGSS